MRKRHRSLRTTVEQPVPVTCYIPYTKATERLQVVVDAVRIQRVQPVMVQVGNDDRYWRMLRDAWEASETFYVVEQDVFVWQGAFWALEECDERWCTLPTMCHGRMISTTFGCVKFSKRLLEQTPGFWDDITPEWFHLDAHFSDKMGWPFIKPHTHWPPASHLNEVQWPDEVSTRFALERKVVWQSMEEGHAVARVNYRLPGEKGRGQHVSSAQIEEE